MSPLVRFLTDEGRDAAGRTLEDVLAFDDAELEARHDFIQWLFPLPEPSLAVPGSPVLSDEDERVLKADLRAQANLRSAAARMGVFYARTDHWLRSHDHNHLRITRIIRSLRRLAGDEAADGFRAAVLARAEGGAVNTRSLAFWMAA